MNSITRSFTLGQSADLLKDWVSSLTNLAERLFPHLRYSRGCWYQWKVSDWKPMSALLGWDIAGQIAFNLPANPLTTDHILAVYTFLAEHLSSGATGLAGDKEQKWKEIAEASLEQIA